MRLKKVILLLIAAVSVQVSVSAQTLTGIVMDASSRKPLESATIAIYKSDSILVLSALTDKLGKFNFNKLAVGKYLIKASFTGYDVSSTFIDSRKDNLAIDTIMLKRSNILLNAVNVRAEKPIIETKIDKIIVNVDGTVLSKGNSVLDVLKKSPGISADINNNIQFNGKSGVTILLDEKSTNLSPTDLSNLLSSMSATSIQSIELMANPPSKYDAAGNGGVVNIITKKKRSDGFSLNISNSATVANHFRNDASVNFIQKIKQLSHYHNFSYSNGQYKYDFTSNRFIPFNNTTYESASTLSQHSRSYFYRGGVDYKLSEKSTIGVLFTANLNRGNALTNADTKISTRPSDYNNLTTLNDNKSRFNGYGYNAYYENKIDTTGQNFSLSFDYNHYGSGSNGKIINAGDVGANQALIYNSTGNTIRIHSGKADYVLPITKRWTLETGLKTSYVNTQNDILYENLIGNSFQIDSLRTNKFHLKENINAAYGSLASSFGKHFSAKAGARLEQTNNTSKSDQGLQYENHYLNLFPTLFLEYKTDANSFSFSYGKRLDRPSYKDLNPFIYYNNPYSFYTGNPFLRPQFTDNFTLSYALKQKYFFSVNYMIVHGVFNTLPTLDTLTNMEISKPVNLDNQRLLYLSASVPFSFNKWWSVYTYANFYYSKFQSSYLNDEFTLRKPTMYIYQDHTFKFSAKGSFNVLFTYDAPQISGFYTIQHRFQTNASIQFSFLKNDAAYVKLGANDIFKGSTTKNSYSYKYLIGNSTGYYDNRYVKLTVSYNLNKLKSNVSTDHSRSNEEERNRIN